MASMSVAGLLGELNPEVNHLQPGADGRYHPRKRINDQSYQTLRVRVKNEAEICIAVKRGSGRSFCDPQNQVDECPSNAQFG
jgi:hypothetical protein